MISALLVWYRCQGLAARALAHAGAATVFGVDEERFWRSNNPEGVRRAGNHHRTLATYLNSLIAAGFVIDAVEEPQPTPLLAARQPQYASVPIFWATRAHAV